MAEKHTSVGTEEPPPIGKTDVKQYANILAKKSHLNENKQLVIEDVPASQPQQNSMPQNLRPAGDSISKININTVLQDIQKKYTSAIAQEKNIMMKILIALSR